MNLKDIKLTTAELFDSLAFAFQTPMRLCYVLSDCLAQERAIYLEQFLTEHTQLVLAPSFSRPKDLFTFLKANQQATIYFEDEILSKRVEYIRLLEGAICANDLGEPRRMVYDTESFVFTGKLLIASRLSEEELKNREQLHYLLRDSIVM